LIIGVLMTLILLVGCSQTESTTKDHRFFDNPSPVEAQQNTDINDNANDAIELFTGEWEPFVGESLPNHGVATEIVKASFKAVNQEVKLTFLPWSRIMEQLKTQNPIVTYPWAITQERLEEFNASESFFTSNNVFFYMKNNHDIPEDFTSFDAIDHLKIGAIRSYLHTDILIENGLNPDLADNEVQSIQKLVSRPLDMIVMNDVVGNEIIHNSFPDYADEITHLKTPLTSAQLGLLTSKDSEETQRIINLFNDGLKRIQESGEYDTIIEKYGYSKLFYE